MFNIFLNELMSNLPNLIFAILILFLGLLVSNKVAAIIVHFLNKLRLNQILSSLGWQDFFDRFDTKINVSYFFGLIVQVYFLLLFLVISLDILSLTIVGNLIGEIIKYYPNIFISIIIFIFTVFIADFSKKIIVGNFAKETTTYSNFLGNIFASGAWIIAILAILYQLQITQELILIIFIGFISLVVLTVGIAFGIGGKDMAKRILEDAEKKIK